MKNNSESRVFVTQEVFSIDYTSAAKWGDIVFITSSSDKMSSIPGSLNNRGVINKIIRILEGFRSNDFLVCSGSPAIMAISAAVLGDRLEKILAWDARSASYFEINIK